MRKTISEFRKKEIINDLKRVGSLNNGKVSFFVYSQHGTYSMPSIVNYFGGMKKACQMAGVEWERKKKVIDPEILKRNTIIKKRVLAGETYESIGKDFSMTRERVRQIIEKFGVVSLVHEKAALKRREPTKEELVSIAHDYAHGMRQGKLAKKYNMVSSHVSSIIKKHVLKFGMDCQGCGAHVTHINKSLHTWKYCDDCARKLNTKRCVAYFKHRLRTDPAFKKKIYARNEKWRKENPEWLKQYAKERAKLKTQANN